MKPTHLSLVCVLLSTLCGAASATGPCYTVYGKKDAIVYRSEEPPVDLSKPISSGIDKQFPGGHLVTQSGAPECPRVLPAGTQPNSFGVSPDGSPALLLPTPFSEVQARADGAAPGARRKRASRRGAAPAATVAKGAAAKAAVAAVPTPPAASATPSGPVADSGLSDQAGAVRMTSYRRSDGRVSASYTRTSGSRGRL